MSATIVKQSMMSGEVMEKDQLPSKPFNTENPISETSSGPEPSSEVRRKDLIVKSYDIEPHWTLLAVISLWILLAGFMVFPATFPSLQNSSSLGSSGPGRVVQHAIQNVPLLVLATICLVGGTVGICYLWRKHRSQYPWLTDTLFL